MASASAAVHVSSMVTESDACPRQHPVMNPSASSGPRAGSGMGAAPRSPAASTPAIHRIRIVLSFAR